jgi:propanol-preferring alcohol dehydrogenase
MTVPQEFVYAIPEALSDLQAAPLLCAGAIGYRSLRLCDMEDGQRLGLSGFGASGHLVLLTARQMFPNSEVYVFSRSPGEQEFARELGAAWTGDFDTPPPHQMERIIETTPAWKPVLISLENLKPGGRLVINVIRKEAGDQAKLAELDYARHLWMEKEIKSVANITREDVQEFLELAASMGLQPEVQAYSLEDANQALGELKNRKIRGAKVLVIE